MNHDPATEQERAAHLDLKQRCHWLYGMGLQERLATQREDIRAWAALGRIQSRPGCHPGLSSEGGAAAEAEAPRRVRETIHAVAREAGVSPADIMGHRRTGPIAAARQECYRRLREMPWAGGRPSLLQIGAWLHRDHTTIHEGLKG